MKKIFLDTEFTGLHQQSTLISLALVAESGEEFYAEFTDYNLESTNELTIEFLNKYVYPKLGILSPKFSDNGTYILGTKSEIAISIEKWLNQFGIIYNEKGEIIPNIQIWADCYAWDWVLFCNLFGGAFTIPPQIHYMTMDFATYLFTKNINHLKKRSEIFFEHNNQAKYIDINGLEEHHALYDARLECYTYKIISK